MASILGPLASIPLVARVLFPRLTSQIRRSGRQFRAAAAGNAVDLGATPRQIPGPENGQIGYSLARNDRRSSSGCCAMQGSRLDFHGW